LHNRDQSDFAGAIAQNLNNQEHEQRTLYPPEHFLGAYTSYKDHRELSGCTIGYQSGERSSFQAQRHTHQF
jgi:hypothetical protein